jgi:hypothetical protein
LPNCLWPSTKISSSSTLHSPVLMPGTNCCRYLLRHCLGARPNRGGRPISWLNVLATVLQFFSPCLDTALHTCTSAQRLLSTGGREGRGCHTTAVHEALSGCCHHRHRARRNAIILVTFNQSGSSCGDARPTPVGDRYTCCRQQSYNTHSRSAASSSGLQDPLKCVLSTAMPPAQVTATAFRTSQRKKTPRARDVLRTRCVQLLIGTFYHYAVSQAERSTLAGKMHLGGGSKATAHRLQGRLINH